MNYSQAVTFPANTTWHNPVTYTTFGNELAYSLLNARNTEQDPSPPLSEQEIGHFHEKLIWNDETVIHELAKSKQQRALRPTCLAIIDTFIPSAWNFFSRTSKPDTRPTLEDAVSHHQDLGQLEAGMTLFHTWCEGDGEPAQQGDPAAAVNAMMKYAEDDRNDCLQEYHQRLALHRDPAEITPLLQGHRNDSSYLSQDLNAFEDNAFTPQPTAESENSDTAAQQQITVMESSDLAIARDDKLAAAEQCVLENDQRIEELHEIKQLFLPARSALTDLAHRLYNLLRGG